LREKHPISVVKHQVVPEKTITKLQPQPAHFTYTLYLVDRTISPTPPTFMKSQLMTKRWQNAAAFCHLYFIQ